MRIQENRLNQLPKHTSFSSLLSSAFLVASSSLVALSIICCRIAWCCNTTCATSLLGQHDRHCKRGLSNDVHNNNPNTHNTTDDDDDDKNPNAFTISTARHREPWPPGSSRPLANPGRILIFCLPREARPGQELHARKRGSKVWRSHAEHAFRYAPVSR